MYVCMYKAQKGFVKLLCIGASQRPTILGLYKSPGSLQIALCIGALKAPSLWGICEAPPHIFRKKHMCTFVYKTPIWGLHTHIYIFQSFYQLTLGFPQ